MAKLYFRYSSMGAGKTLDLLKVAYNYEERNKRVLLYTSSFDDRYGIGVIKSRTGLEKEAKVITEETNIYEDVAAQGFHKGELSCILVDEAQFLKKHHVRQLTDIVDYLGVPVICYGLRSDYRGEPFEGSTYLMALADTIEEIKTICSCERKAIMNARIENNRVVYEGEQIIIGGNEKYIALCRKDWKQGIF